MNDKLIPTSAFVVVGMGTLASVEKSQSLPGINFWLGIAIAYMFIALLDQLDPNVGGGLAVLVMVSGMLGYGSDVTNYFSKKTGGKIGGSQKTKASRPPTTLTMTQSTGRMI